MRPGVWRNAWVCVCPCVRVWESVHVCVGVRACTLTNFVIAKRAQTSSSTEQVLSSAWHVPRSLCRLYHSCPFLCTPHCGRRHDGTSIETPETSCGVQISRLLTPCARSSASLTLWNVLVGTGLRFARLSFHHPGSLT